MVEKDRSQNESHLNFILMAFTSLLFFYSLCKKLYSQFKKNEMHFCNCNICKISKLLICKNSKIQYKNIKIFKQECKNRQNKNEIFNILNKKIENKTVFFEKLFDFISSSKLLFISLLILIYLSIRLKYFSIPFEIKAKESAYEILNVPFDCKLDVVEKSFRERMVSLRTIKSIKEKLKERVKITNAYNDIKSDIKKGVVQEKDNLNKRNELIQDIPQFNIIILFYFLCIAFLFVKFLRNYRENFLGKNKFGINFATVEKAYALFNTNTIENLEMHNIFTELLKVEIGNKWIFNISTDKAYKNKRDILLRNILEDVIDHLNISFYQKQFNNIDFVGAVIYTTIYRSTILYDIINKNIKDNSLIDELHGMINKIIFTILNILPSIKRTVKNKDIFENLIELNRNIISGLLNQEGIKNTKIPQSKKSKADRRNKFIKAASQTKIELTDVELSSKFEPSLLDYFKNCEEVDINNYENFSIQTDILGNNAKTLFILRKNSNNFDAQSTFIATNAYKVLDTKIHAPFFMLRKNNLKNSNFFIECGEFIQPKKSYSLILYKNNEIMFSKTFLDFEGELQIQSTETGISWKIFCNELWEEGSGAVKNN